MLIPAGARSQPASAAFSTASPCTPPPATHQRGSASRGINERFKRFTRPVFPSPVTPGWNGSALGFSPSFAPRRPGAERRTSRRGQATEHGPGTTLTPHQTNLQSRVHSYHATSRRIARFRAVGITPGMPVAKSQQVPRPIRSQVRERRSALADHASSGHGGAAHRFVCRKGSPIETASWATPAVCLGDRAKARCPYPRRGGCRGPCGSGSSVQDGWRLLPTWGALPMRVHVCARRLVAMSDGGRSPGPRCRDTSSGGSFTRDRKSRVLGLGGAVPWGDRAQRRRRWVGSFVSEGKAGTVWRLSLATRPAVDRTAARNEPLVLQIRCESWTPASYS